jgi:photosystem II stability/assembly factor-like uncharacterized protein
MSRRAKRTVAPSPRDRARGKAGASARRRPWLGGAIAAAVVAVVAVAGIMVAAAPRAVEAEAAPVEQFTHIHGLQAPAWAGGDVFVSTHFGLLRIDGSGTWSEVGTDKHDFMGFTAHPSESGVLYSSGHPAAGSALPNPIGFMVSRDAGLTWTPVALAGRADFHVLSVQPSDGDVIYGFNAAIDPGLYRSLDGGRTWSVIDSPSLMRLGGPYALAVHPDDRDVLLAGTRDGLLTSRDGGRTWEVSALEGVPVTAVTFVLEDPVRAFAYGATPDTGLFVSEDGGAWTSLDFVLDGNDAVGYIAVGPAPEATIYLGSYGQSLYRRSGDGSRWQPLALNGVPQ